MLNTQKICGKLTYYLRYGRGDAETGWLGQGAADLGLADSIDPAVFLALGRGAAPGGGRLLERIVANRTPGWDISLSPPKSVSLAWALADDPLRRRLLGAHRRATAAAFHFLEREGGRAQRGDGGRGGHVRAGLVIACFTHPASRELDPHLHTHGVILNVTHGTDGRWTSLDSRTIYLHRGGADAIYRAELRKGVAAFGGQWGAPNRYGSSDLEGFDHATLRHFSQRKREITSMLEMSGRSDRFASTVAARATRLNKIEVELDDLRPVWTSRAARCGWDARRVASLLDGTDRREQLDNSSADRLRDHLLAAGGLTKSATAFTRDDVVVAWSNVRRQGASLKELDELTNATLADDQIVPLVVADAGGTPLTTTNLSRRGEAVRLVVAPGSKEAELTRERRYSTLEMLRTETEVLELAEKRRRAEVAKVRTPTLEMVLAKRSYLSNEQVDAVQALCASGDGVSLLASRPGSAVTFVLEAARAAWSAEGFQVIGAGPGLAAASQLEAGTKIVSEPLDHLLAALERDSADPLESRLDRRSVVVVDDSGLVDTRRLTRLFHHARRVGAKVVLTGDERHCASIETAAAYAALVRHFGAATLADNGAHLESWARRANEAPRRASSGAMDTPANGRDHVHFADEPGGLLERMVESWWAAREVGEEALLVADSRGVAHMLNRITRARRAGAGQLSGPELELSECRPGDLPARSYRVGEAICCLRDRTGSDPSGLASGRVRAGTLGTIVAIDDRIGHVTLAVAGSEPVSLPEDYVRRFTDYGYVATIHKEARNQTTRAVRPTSSPQQRRALTFSVESQAASSLEVASAMSSELFVLVDPGETVVPTSAEAAVLGRVKVRPDGRRYPNIAPERRPRWRPR